MITILYLLTGSVHVIWYGLLYATLVYFCFVLFIVLVRQKLTGFSNTLCRTLDDMMSGSTKLPQVAEEESLLYKINHRIARLYEVMRENRINITKERTELQELLSDISHQVKTPIANLKMVNVTLIEQSMPINKQKEFLYAIDGQLDKLDFLMQALIKTSRLETGVISLKKEKQAIYDTIAEAMGGILLNAEKKHISVEVDCIESLEISHDRKWTSEALFNILDNAIKYTPDDGSIQVLAVNLEMYLKIDITDTGKGISENHHGEIFKRFYREEDVHDIPGIGIGLFLARKIITMQGGYIKVTSDIGQGSTFSVFLPHN